MRTSLLPHNKTAYKKVMRMFETSDRTCVVHPTGTGKSYLIAAVSESYKKVLILGPNTFVLDQVHDVLKWRDSEKAAGKVEYMTYQTLNLMEEVPTGYDLICLDEFHRAGAPSWGVAVDDLLARNRQAKIFGTTATPIRYLDNERNMADELFHNNVASHIGIGEAWSRSILPIPSFVIGLFNFHKTIKDAEERINASKKLSPEEKRRRIYKLSNARLEWEQSIGMPQILRRHLDADIRRVIIFCADISRLESMRDTVVGWFRVAGFTVASACTVHVGIPEKDRQAAMDEFESDEGNGVRLMFSVDMLNEGVHIPRVGAVLMLRTTASRIIYMQQMGRCLTAANTEKPVILDMVDNITTTSAVHGLSEDFLGWEKYIKGDLHDEDRRFNITDYKQSVRDVLEKLSPLELSFETWEEKLQQLIDFCEKHGRTPSRNDGNIFRKYMYLIHNYRETDEMKFIIQKYGRQIMWNENNRGFMEQELREFIDTHHRAPSRWLPEDLRWYKMLKVINKHEPEHPIVIECRQIEEQRKADERERYYWECVDTLTAFCEQTGRIPKTTPLPDGTYEPYRKWRWLRQHYPDRQEVADIREKYVKHVVGPRTVLPLEKRIDLCEAICKQYNRQPHASYDDPTSVKSWKYLKRLHADHPRVQALMQYPVLSFMHKRIDIGIKKVEDFYEKYGRLPGHGNGISEEEKQARNSMLNIFEKYADEPRVQALMEKRPKRRNDLQKSIDWMLRFEEKHGRLPMKSETNAYARLRNLINNHYDEPEVFGLMEKYDDPDGCDWLASDEEREAAKTQQRRMKSYEYQCGKYEKDLSTVRQFTSSNGRLPRLSNDAERDEVLAYYALRNLKDNYRDQKDVIELLDKFPSVLPALEEGIGVLLAFEQREGRLPRDTQDSPKEERRALAAWKSLRANHPEHPVTKMMNERYPYGCGKLGMAIARVEAFVRKHHRLPRTHGNADKEEQKCYEKWIYLRKNHPANAAVKRLADKYAEGSSRTGQSLEAVLRLTKWADQHGRLPKKNLKDKDEFRRYNSFLNLKRRHPDLKELLDLIEKYDTQLKTAG